jgi:hypothetical protein
MIPAEIGCSSHRVVLYTSEDNQQGLKAKLDFLEKSCLTITTRNEEYSCWTVQCHNARVNNRKFKFRDLLLRKLKVIGNRESKGKLASKWDGHFKVTRIVKANTSYLQDIEGKSLSYADTLIIWKCIIVND